MPERPSHGARDGAIAPTAMVDRIVSEAVGLSAEARRLGSVADCTTIDLAISDRVTRWPLCESCVSRMVERYFRNLEDVCFVVP